MSSNTVFRKLLKTESSAALPVTEDDVDALFDLYQVRPEARPGRRSRNSNPSAERLEMAAGILWFHTHVNEPGPALDRLSFVQQEKLVECFVPDFAIFAGDPGWHRKLAGFFKFAAPSDSTPQKRAAPAARARASPAGGAAAGGERSAGDQRVDKGVPQGGADDLDDDSEVEGGGALSGVPDFASLGGGVGGGSGPPGSGGRPLRPLHKKKKKKKTMKGKKSKHSREHKSKGGTSSSGSSSEAEPQAPVAGPVAPATSPFVSGAWALPAVLDASAELKARVEAACGKAPAWRPSADLIVCLRGTDWFTRLYRDANKSPKQLRDYEKYLEPVLTAENRDDPLWLHRLTLLYRGDAGFSQDAKMFALLAVGESPTDYASSAGFRDSDGMRKYVDAVAGLKAQWVLIEQSAQAGCDPGESVYGNFKSQFLGMYARRYTLMHSHLLGHASSTDDSVRLAAREVLSHSARQCLEIQVYTKRFFDDVCSRAGTMGATWTFSARAGFVHQRVLAVFGDAVKIFIENDGGLHPGLAWQVGAAAAAGAPPAPTASPWFSLVSSRPGGPGSSPLWGPPPPYAPPGASPAPSLGYALGAAGGASLGPPGPPQGDPRPVAPHPVDGWQGQGSGSGGGAQRGAKRGLQAAMDGAYSQPGAGQGGPGGAGPGRSDGRGPAAEPAPPPSSRVRFDPVVKVEQHQGGAVGGVGGSGQQKDGHLALPAHHWILGKFAPFLGPGSLQPECMCWKKFDAHQQAGIGPHARWDCPLRFVAQCGYCPGFTNSGLRLRSAWVDHDTMTPDTVEEWKRLIEAKGLRPARGAPGPPSFP